MAQDYAIGPRGPVGGTSNGAAVYLPHRRHPAITIQNNGTVIVYANDEDPINGPSRGQPISAGSTLGWDADRPLYLTADTSCPVTITQNSGTLFNVGALAGQISTNLNTSGLAQAIADNIYNSGLAAGVAANIQASGLTAANIASNISVSGAPPIDAQALIVNSGVFTGSYASAAVDTTKYQSIALIFKNFQILSGRISIQWYAEAGLVNLIGYDECIAGTGALTTFYVPVRAPFFQLLIDGSGQNFGSQVRVYGSYKALAANLYKAQGQGVVTGPGSTVDGSTDMGIQTWAGTLPNTAGSNTWQWQPGVIAGEANLSLRYVGATTISLLARIPTFIYGLTTYYATTNLAVTNGQTDNVKLFLPPVPFELQVTNSGAASTQIRFTLSSLRPYVS